MVEMAGLLSRGLGLRFEGRAHDGLVDSRNTAFIALHMARGSMLRAAFVFRRPTRGLDAYGHAFGSRLSRDAKAAETGCFGLRVRRWRSSACSSRSYGWRWGPWGRSFSACEM